MNFRLKKFPTVNSSFHRIKMLFLHSKIFWRSKKHHFFRWSGVSKKLSQKRRDQQGGAAQFGQLPYMSQKKLIHPPYWHLRNTHPKLWVSIHREKMWNPWTERSAKNTTFSDEVDCIKIRVKTKWFFTVFRPFFGPFWPLFCTGNRGQKEPKKGQNPVKKHSFLTRILIHSTSSEKVVFFAGRSVQGFQNPYYFPVNRHTQFWVGVATVYVFKSTWTHIF